MFSGDLCAVVSNHHDGESAVGIGHAKLTGLLGLGTCLLLVSGGCWRACVIHDGPSACSMQPGCDDSCSTQPHESCEEAAAPGGGCRICGRFRPVARVERPVVEAAYYSHPRFHPMPVRPVFSPRLSPVPTSDALVPEVLPTPPPLPPGQIELVPPGTVPEQIRAPQPVPERTDRLTREPRALGPVKRDGSWIFRPATPKVSDPVSQARLERQGGDDWRTRR